MAQLPRWQHHRQLKRRPSSSNHRCRHPRQAAKWPPARAIKPWNLPVEILLGPPGIITRTEVGGDKGDKDGQSISDSQTKSPKAEFAAAQPPQGAWTTFASWLLLMALGPCPEISRHGSARNAGASRNGRCPWISWMSSWVTEWQSENSYRLMLKQLISGGSSIWRGWR